MEGAMPRNAIEDNSRMSLRISAADKALLMRAAALEQTGLTDFVLRNVAKAAREVVERAERHHLSERDTAYVLALLENPPEPNAKLLAAAKALPKRK
jgi:uncharacterized protein (DUF1778 family)